jgi:hypothetical protein
VGSLHRPDSHNAQSGCRFRHLRALHHLGHKYVNVLIGYYENLLNEPFVYVNALRIGVNAAIVAYMFKAVFDGKFK